MAPFKKTDVKLIHPVWETDWLELIKTSQGEAPGKIMHNLHIT